jgi:hypothetical protein
VDIPGRQGNFIDIALFISESDSKFLNKIIYKKRLSKKIALLKKCKSSRWNVCKI